MTQEKETQSSKTVNKGFTLIELLVVVLIIGILAGIALPQYQVAVGKAKFSTLKNLTKSLQQSAQRYYMVNNTYEGLNTAVGRKSLDIELPAESNCQIWVDEYPQVRCCKNIFNVFMCFYVNRETGMPMSCAPWSKDKTDYANRLCQIETGTNASQAKDYGGNNLTYYY